MPRLALLRLLALLLAGCGGGGADGDRSAQSPPRSTPSAQPRAEPRGGGEKPAPRRDGPVTRGEAAIIRGWSDALRRGDVTRAVGYWAIPSVASNGGQPIRLMSGKAVRFFNEALPCGAKLESATRDGAGYVLAVFRLTERPGEGECVTGVGEKARTLFLLRDGKIVQWLRASDPRPPAQTPGGSES